MQKATVSIIVPIHNTSKYLDRCLNSLENQTLNNIEILLLDDFSTDDSWDKVLTFKNAHPKLNILVYKNRSNRGAAYTRNLGIELSVGEFVGFVDSDDYVDLEYFKNLYKQRKDYDIIRGIRLVDGKHCKNPYGCLVPSIIRRELLFSKPYLRFPIKDRGEDSDLRNMLFKETDKILETKDNGIYYHYERREGSLSNYKL